MLKWLSKLKPAVLFAFCFLIVLEHSQAYSAPDVSYEISDVKVTLVDNTLTYTIFGSSVPVYTVSERFSPFRVVVDIAGGSYGKDFNSSLAKLPENRFAELTTTEVKTQTPPVLRYEFKLADSHDYSVNAQGNNLEIKLVPANSKNSSLQKDGKKSEPLTLKDFIVNSAPNKTTITIISSGPLEHYTVDTAAATNDLPARMFIDFKGIKADELVKEKQIGTSVSKIRVTSTKDKGVRIYFDSASKQLFKYAVAPTEQGLNVVIDETAQAQKDSGKNQEADKKGAGDTTLDALIGSSQHSVTSGAEKVAKANASTKASALENDFAFSGYNKQRISVDFYKIDIHNVFRLFKQITDLNIIVDEEVQGTLTLALNDVPWDFALDIILNLMDLKKEERFNTIVIYPSKKAFVWPNRAEDNLAIKADVQVIEQEALVIEKSATQSKEVTEARELIGKAKILEKDQSLEDAAELYEKAVKLWPQNTNLSNHLTTLYLVSLGQNAKALYLAKQTLKHDSKNFRAALYAAIASANMQKIAEASEYFNQSVSGTPPMKEALISYAAFSENNGQNDAALKLLDKYQKIHGDSLDSMIARARILDKVGRPSEASQQYKAIISSGFDVRPDMKKFIENRLATKELQ